MSSQRRIEANRRNARKSTGPKTRRGKSRSSRNSFRHGLESFDDNEEAGRKRIRLMNLLVRPGADEAEWHQAGIVADCLIRLSRVRTARVMAVERMRRRAARSFESARSVEEKILKAMECMDRGEPLRAARKLRRMAGRLFGANRRYQAERRKCWRSAAGEFVDGEDTVYRDGERAPRSDAESILLAIDELRALDRYEKRALSRRKAAIETLMAIRHIADLRAGRSPD